MGFTPRQGLGFSALWDYWFPERAHWFKIPQCIKLPQRISIGFTPMFYGFCVSKKVLFEWGSSSIVWA